MNSPGSPGECRKARSDMA